ncbi:hypothetical protein INR49_005883 [Caranx melampygus]|nr:hypothetical protein INR49_005883 [Caranx melampygus]
MKKLTANKDQCLEESYHPDQTGSNRPVDSLSTHVHLDFLIEKMKKKGDPEKVEKLKEMKGRHSQSQQRAAGLHGNHGPFGEEQPRFGRRAEINR